MKSIVRSTFYNSSSNLKMKVFALIFAFAVCVLAEEAEKTLEKRDLLLGSTYGSFYGYPSSVYPYYGYGIVKRDTSAEEKTVDKRAIIYDTPYYGSYRYRALPWTYPWGVVKRDTEHEVQKRDTAAAEESKDMKRDVVLGYGSYGWPYYNNYVRSFPYGLSPYYYY